MIGKLTPNLAITGATGFLGSALAANALHRGGRVIAISRNDPTGARTINAIRAAAKGFGLSPIEPLIATSLKVVAADLEPAALAEICDQYFNEYSVWHSAAQMTYAPEQLAESMATNMMGSSRLYQAFSRASGCKRFFYVSTAYTAGFGITDVPEALHCQPRLINVYQTSKWGAEMSLAANCLQRLPLTLFRPAIIVGHDHTGWHGNSKFGLYGFLAASFYARNLRSRQLEMDINPQAKPNFVPINRVIDDALVLESCQNRAPQLQVVHSVASEHLSNQDIADTISALWNIDISLTEPKNRLSRKINEALVPNQPFANSSFSFAQQALPELLGERFSPYRLTGAALERLIQSFAAEQGFMVENSRPSPNLVSM